MTVRKIAMRLSLPLVLLVTVPCCARVCDVTELGAKGDKQSNAGPMIQAAIDRCAAAGGGTVFVSAGDYLCGQLVLKSNVMLHLEAGATLWVSPKKEDYSKGNRFLFADGRSNITIQGRGTIHGTGEADLARKKTDKPEPRPEFRVGILVQGMSAARIENLSLRNVTMRVDRAFDYAARKKHVGGKVYDTQDRRETIYARKPSYVTLANIDGLTIDALRVFIPDEVFSKHPRSALSVHSASNATIRDVRRRPVAPESEVPVVVLEDVPKGAMRD